MMLIEKMVPDREYSARLGILTERLRRPSPRVTADDLEVLTEMIDEVEKISQSLKDTRKKFEIE